MTPKKFKKICKRYFIDSAFTMEDISNVDDKSITISKFYLTQNPLTSSVDFLILKTKTNIRSKL